MKNIMTTPLSPEDHREVLRRISTRTMYLVPKLQEMSEYFSADTSAQVRDVWESTETSILFLLLSAFQLRGASPGSISRYVAHGTGALPFRGCERKLFDSVLASMRAKASDPHFLDRASIEFTAFIDQMIRLIANECHITRPVLCQIILRSRVSE